MSGRTTLIIAHRLSTIALADEIVVLDGGPHRRRGTHEELLETSPVYREIYEHGLLERQFADAVEARAERALEEASACVRVWQAGSHLMRERAASVEDWSWRQTRRRLGTLLAAHESVPHAHDPLGGLAAARDGHRARASAARQVRARRRHRATRT